jgi:hypothetical protein
MADDKRNTPPKTPPSPDSAKRRRPAPTIDLTATEVGAPKHDVKTESPSAQPAAAPPRAQASSSRGFGLAYLIAGIAGGVVVALVLSALWLAGVVPAANTASLDDLKARLGKLEQAPPNTPAPDSATAARLTAAENTIKTMSDTLAALTRRADEIAGTAAAASKTAAGVQDAIRNTPSSQADIDALQKRIDTLASATTATQEKVAQASGADRTARLALAALSLRDAVTRGQPFAPQLAAARTLGAGAKFIAPLEPFAVSGVPNDVTLGRELAALLPAMMAASGANTTASGGFMERLQDNAERLVRVRPVDAPAGDDASAVLARLDIDAAHHDVNAALADIAKLPPAARAPADGWIKTAQSRKAALAAADALVAETAVALGKSSGTP